MKKKRFSVEQMIGVLKQAEVGVPVANLIHFQTGVLRLPPVKCLFADPCLADHLVTGTPTSACFKTPIICSTLNRFFRRCRAG